MNLFGTYPLHELPNLALKEEEFEQILSQSEKKDQNDLLLSPPTHSSQFFVKSLFLKNSKINQEKVDMKEKAKIKKEPKEKKILIYERVKKYMARNNLSPRECAILSNVPDIINSRNGVVCLPVIKRVELYFSGKYLDHNYDQLFRRWLIYKRETDWKELRKKHFQKKEFDTHAVDYHFEDYTSEEIRSMIKKIIQKSKKTEYKLSQSKIAAIVNIDKFRFRNVKYTMQKYLTGKSSSKDHSLDRKFYDWLFLRGKLLPPLSKSLTFSDSNEKGDEEFTEKEQEHEQEQEQEQFRGKVGKNSKIQTKNNNNGHDRKHGHKHRHKHRSPKRNHNKLNSNDNLDDLVQNLRSHQRKIKNKSKKKSKSKKKKSKNLTRKKKKKFSKSHIPNEIDQNYTNKLIPTLRAGSFDFNSVQIKQRKRKPNNFEKKMLKKKIKNI
ncbi:snf1-activating kinase 1 [Anaeramoeba flamelloides]|uniref:Snf1-activating kinase 1 n=1 Tax=Anaeramoeba flamelloides TaxID=1746091 RepID=A0ABQ8YPD4_9EUKA|nr:snf1-activating kinase 1 [Anaeramoeba flamelloides]